MKTKLMVKHSTSCTAMKSYKKGSWPTPWAFITGDVSYGTKINPVSKRGSKRWVYVRCNSLACPGTIAVLEQDILEALNEPPK